MMDKRPLFVIFFILSFAMLFHGTVSLAAQGDIVAIRETAVGSSKQDSVQKAYLSAFLKMLTGEIGTQAEGEIGAYFKRNFDRDFDAFIARYFTPGTDYRCQQQNNGRFLCEIEGEFKVAALDATLRKAIATKKRALLKRMGRKEFKFALSPDPKDGTEAYIVDKLAGHFQKDGHVVFRGKDAVKQIVAKKVDFALGIFELALGKLNYDAANLRMSGGLKVRFRLSFIPTGEGIDTVPIVVKMTVAGAAPEELEAEIVDKLAAKAADEIGRRTSSGVVTFLLERQQKIDDEKRLASGEEVFLLRLVGITQRDRKTIRAVRKAVSKLYADAKPKVVGKESDRTRVTLQFSTATEVIPDDFLDYLFEVMEAQREFDVEALGDNEFALYMGSVNRSKGAGQGSPPPETIDGAASKAPLPESSDQEQSNEDDEDDDY